MKLIAVGDNVTDCYMDEGVYFPGGNAVNVAVNCRKNGAEQVEYIGIFGDDENAQWIRACLAEEGVGFSRSRRVYAPSARPRPFGYVLPLFGHEYFPSQFQRLPRERKSSVCQHP